MLASVYKPARRESKNGIKVLSIYSPDIDRFSTFFIDKLSRKFATAISLKFSLHLKVKY